MRGCELARNVGSHNKVPVPRNVRRKAPEGTSQPYTKARVYAYMPSRGHADYDGEATWNESCGQHQGVYKVAAAAE